MATPSFASSQPEIQALPLDSFLPVDSRSPLSRIPLLFSTVAWPLASAVSSLGHHDGFQGGRPPRLLPDFVSRCPRFSVARLLSLFMLSCLSVPLHMWLLLYRFPLPTPCVWQAPTRFLWYCSVFPSLWSLPWGLLLGVKCSLLCNPIRAFIIVPLSLGYSCVYIFFSIKVWAPWRKGMCLSNVWIRHSAIQ